MMLSTILNSGLSVDEGSGSVLSSAYAFSALTPSASNSQQIIHAQQVRQWNSIWHGTCKDDGRRRNSSFQVANE